MLMEIGTKTLEEIIIEFDRYLTRKTRVIAVGGTALTLLGKKASTRDIDLCFTEERVALSFIQAAKKMGYRSEMSNKLMGKSVIIDVYSNGYIFCVQLPEDYSEKAVKIRDFHKIELYALAPIDLLITKAARFNERDKEDIMTIIRSYKIDEKELVERWISTMENSMVRDAKDHLRALLMIFEESGIKDDEARKTAEEWLNG